MSDNARLADLAETGYRFGESSGASMKLGRAAVAIACVFGLSACGGGGGGSGSPQFIGTPTGSGGTSTTPPTSTPSTPPDASGSGSGTPPGGSTDSGSGTGTAPPPSGPSGPTTSTSTVAMIVALPGPPGGMQLRDLNDNGHAAGIATTGSFPMSVSAQNYHVANADNFYQGDGTAFPTTVAGNNDAGVIAGLASPAGQPPFAYTWNGASLTRLPPPPQTWLYTGGVAGIDDAGRVGVTFQVSERQLHTPYAHLYANGSYQAFPSVSVNGEMTRALALSDNGKLLAQAQDRLNGEIYLALWDYPAGTVQAIRRFGASDWTSCRCVVYRLTNNGDVLLGTAGSPGGNVWPMIANATGSVALPAAVNSVTMDMNDARQVVGGLQGSPQFWNNGTLHDLNTYAESDKLGWRFLTAERINNRRQILGRGTFNGQERWYLLTLQ